MKQAYIKLGGLLLEEKKFADLVKLTKAWSETDPTNPYAWLYMAFAYQSTKDIDNACASYKKVLKIDPKNTSALKNLKALGCP